MTSGPGENDYDNALAGWFSRPQPEAAESGEDGAFGAKKGAEQAQALERVREWVRKRFNLPADAAILVSEVACNLPGCPPLETAVAFWDKDETQEEKRHHFKLFKEVTAVAYDDLPFTWMKDSLVVSEGFACECC